MYDRILVPTDGSDCATVAADRAIDLAKTYGADLHVVSVVDRGALGPDVRGEQLSDQLHRSAERAVESTVDRALEAGVESATGNVVEGSPSNAIVEYAGDHDVDLVVMGTHGRSGLDRFLLGSVAERVIRTAPIPVMTVRTPADE